MVLPTGLTDWPLGAVLTALLSLLLLLSPPPCPRSKCQSVNQVPGKRLVAVSFLTPAPLQPCDRQSWWEARCPRPVKGFFKLRSSTRVATSVLQPPFIKFLTKNYAKHSSSFANYMCVN